MTIIEFFEKDAAENLCTCLAKALDRVILLGGTLKQMQKHADRYRGILADRGVEVEILCRSVNKNTCRASSTLCPRSSRPTTTRG